MTNRKFTITDIYLVRTTPLGVTYCANDKTNTVQIIIYCLTKNNISHISFECKFLSKLYSLKVFQINYSRFSWMKVCYKQLE